MPILETKECVLHFEEIGSRGKPTLLFCHSLGAHLGLWDRQAVLFAKDFRVIRCDFRGHGQSSVPLGPYTIEMFGHDMIALLNHLDITRVTFCGLSLGSMVGLWLAVHAPDRLERMVLAGASASVANKAPFDRRILAIESGGIPSIFAELEARWFTANYIKQASPSLHRIKHMVEATPTVGYIAATKAVRDFDIRQQLSTIACDILLVTGAEDVATPPEEAQFIADKVPSASLQLIEKTSHLAQIERADIFDRQLVDFLRPKNS